MQRIDDVDRKILDILIENTRTPFTDIAKRLLISAGTVHVRVKKMEDNGIIKGSSLTLDYKKLGYNFIAYVGVLIDKTSKSYEIIEDLKRNPFITVAHITTGKYNIFLEIRAIEARKSVIVLKNPDNIYDVIILGAGAAGLFV